MASKILVINAKAARRLAIQKQLLWTRPRKVTAKTILKSVDQLGCLQLDPIRAVERTHLLVLWSRLGQYNPRLVDRLLWRDRSLFEFWAHEASIVCTDHYAIHRHHMRDFGKGTSALQKRIGAWLQKNQRFKNYILRTLRTKGPHFARELENRVQVPWVSTGWTAERHVGMMLNFLWMQGYIMVVQRKGMQKQWGLTNQHLPEEVLRRAVPRRQAEKEATRISLRALGVAREDHIKRHFIRNRYPNLRANLQAFQKNGTFVAVTVKDDQVTWPGKWYVDAEDVDDLQALEVAEPNCALRLLSPFDNLICDRKRTRQLWGFDFSIEIYVPPQKRQYGYYVLPILYGDELVGRIDPKMNRDLSRLEINAVHAEPAWAKHPEVAMPLQEGLRRLAEFLGAQEVEFKNLTRVPAKWRAVLRRT